MKWSANVFSLFLVLASSLLLVRSDANAQARRMGNRVTVPAQVTNAYNPSPAGIESKPVFNIWYGKRQTFRKLGVPQRWANILGNVTDSAGVTSLSYTLNGGAPAPLSIGPDAYRLQRAGDFNIDLSFAQLNPLPDSNRVIITATNIQSIAARETVIVRYFSGTIWPTTFTTRWGSSTSLQDSAQVVDGLWARAGNTIHPTQRGYDRMVAIGDTTWTDFEVTVPITINSIDSSGWGSNSGYPTVGLLMRWAGHTDDPIPGMQPKTGYNPYGAIGFYSYVDDAHGPRLQMFGNNGVGGGEDLSGKTLLTGVAYNFKMRVQTIPAGGYYSFKVWQVGQTEPATWDLNYQAGAGDPARGSFTLIANYVDASFGTVTVAPVGADVTPPQISSIKAVAGRTSAEVSWTTDEPATTKVEYGLSGAYGASVIDATLLTSHDVVLTGLQENTLYHYRIVSADGVGNVSASTDRTIITTGASTIVSDEFDGQTLNTGVWTFFNPLSDATHRMTGSQYSLTVPAGTVHDAWDMGNNTPRIMQPSNDTDFDIEVKFDAPMTTQYQTTGIMVQQNASNFLRFDFNSDGANTRLFAAGIINDVPTAISGFNDVIASNGFAPLYMRVKRERNNWTISYSLNNSIWTQALNFTYDMIVTSVGIFGGNNGTPPPAYTALFDYFRGPIPAAPSLISPANNAINQPVNTTFIWSKVSTAIAYRLQVATDSTFATGIVYNDSTLTDTLRTLNGLANNTRFFWRVNTRNSGGTSPFSSRWNFTTIVGSAGVPVLLAPANNATNQPVNPALTWFKAANASTYRLQVSADSTFASGLVLDDSTLTDTTKGLAGLANNTKFYWRVRAANAAGSSAYSTRWNFTTIVGAAGVPALVLPANNTSGLATSVTMIWTKAQNAATYRLQVATDSLFASGIVTDDSTITDTTKLVSGLVNSARYFWRVNAKSAGGTSAFSSTWSFSTSLMTPTLLSPGNRASDQPTSVTLRWLKVPSATLYRLQLGTDSTFAGGLLKNDSSIVDTSRVVSGLSIHSTYFWRINARNSGGNGPFSSVWSFSTMTPLPGQVLLVSPGNGADLNTDSVRCVWHPSTPLVNKYWVELAVDSLFSFRVLDSTVTDTAKMFPSLQLNKPYYWHVRANNPGGWGPFSETRIFTVTSTGVAQTEGVPVEFGLNQNYPNPFNPSTVIRFALPKEGDVKLEVFNLLGDRIATLVDERMPTGFHTVRFDATSGIASGVYFYRLTAGGTVFTKRMMLIK